MKKAKSILIFSIMSIFLLSGVARADWYWGDPHKMHFPQMPNEAGWDVNATSNGEMVPPIVLADDFLCTETGYIEDIHFWGSWLGGTTGPINGFSLSIHADIPAGFPPYFLSYSSPMDPPLWEEYVSAQDIVINGPIAPGINEGWYFPWFSEYLYPDHMEYFQYNIFLYNFLEPVDLFWQEADTIYWLNITADLAEPSSTAWGWKSSLDQWNDGAVWKLIGNPFWEPLSEPTGGTVDLAFVITGGPDEEPTIFPDSTQCPIVTTVCPEVETNCPEAITFCPAIETECPDFWPTWCPENYTWCPKEYTTCPDFEFTICPEEPTWCPAEPFTACPNHQTYCPSPPTQCFIEPTWCPPMPTECPEMPEFTWCPVNETECPDSDTFCPMDWTYCPDIPTVCPDLQTTCPVVPTECPVGVPTECPIVPTTCPDIPTVCSQAATLCDQDFTDCPLAITQCPYSETTCPPDPTPTWCPTNLTYCPLLDSDLDGVMDCYDNCPKCIKLNICPNGPLAGTCTAGTNVGSPCWTPGPNVPDCGTAGYCSMAQEDTRPDVLNNCGDACECEGDLSGDGQVTGVDTNLYKADYNRTYFFNEPCAVCAGSIPPYVLADKCLSDAECGPGGDCIMNPTNPCIADLNCDMQVTGVDTNLYKEDYNRTSFFNEPCPPCSRDNYPCTYPE